MFTWLADMGAKKGFYMRKEASSFKFHLTPICRSSFVFGLGSIANFVLSWLSQPIPRGLVTAARLLNMAAVHCFVH